MKLSDSFKPKNVEKKPEPVVQVSQGEEDVNVEIKESEYDQLINLNECNLKPTEPSSIFTSELHYYQSLALTWTLMR